MSHFEVGKKVIAVKNHSSGLFKKGDVVPLLAIKMGCCHSEIVLQVDLSLGLFDGTCCRKCGKEHPRGEAWFKASRFAPYDDSLSELTTDDILNEIHETVKIK